MADETRYNWPAAEQRTLIGKRISRVDGPDKVSGKAKYTYDVHRPGMLFGKVVRCPHAHAKVVSVDTSAAEKMPGVVAVYVVQGPDSEIHWAGDDIVVVAAVDESKAADAARAVKVKYDVLPHFVDDFKKPENVAEDKGPLDEDGLISMFRNQVPEQQMIDRINQRGVSFKVDKEMVDQLKQNRVSDQMIAALQAAKYREEGGQSESPYRKEAAISKGDPDAAFKEAEVTSEGVYGCPVITHCCLESHGSIAEWQDSQHLFVHLSTQNVSGVSTEYAQALKIPAGNVHVHQDHIGGGFGSKFGADRWGVYTAEVSKKAGGKPVRVMLERAPELEVAGARPSAYARVKVGAKKDGTLLGWESESWGTGGPGGGGAPPMPYVVNIPNQRKQHVAVLTNIGPARAWRAPNHPQGCLITMSALDDMAAKLNMDPVQLLLKNIQLTAPPDDKYGRANTYKDELMIASDLIGWKQNWHPRGEGGSGPVKRGLGVAIHTWGGRGHASECAITIHPEGSVDIKMGTQDLGVGTRTAILIVAGDTLGLPINQMQLYIGDNQYPRSGGSGGSTTIGGISSSTRRAAVDARDQLFAKVAGALNAKPEELEAVGGSIRVKGTPSRSMSWKDACARLGTQPIQALGKNPGPGDLISSGVGGAVMADVSVDTETGVVKMNKMVTVQDCGLVINLKTAESQVYGAMIMGIASTLYEEKVMDPTTGTMLNPNMDFYRLAGIGDVGELVVHMMTGKGYDERGPIGLGEPPTVGPMAAIANAVANAVGVRVPFMPITPNRVVAALNSANGGSHAGV
ncbi:MAG TPA: xanthine dehydrogenase family protein molybdopterin-binding subunit [Candidatus Angelobacter sp.]|jgi:xanthine dehydrogenase YagR molybdenum-binding subunit|nr:xanthine dehydrogenase family protein molybdopterin-binding subunit [Candidatus Angelobacter sp.]